MPTSSCCILRAASFSEKFDGMTSASRVITSASLIAPPLNLQIKSLRAKSILRTTRDEKDKCGARSVMEQLIKTGKVRRGYLGVGVQPVTPEIAESLGLSESRHRQ
jgi:hypothetical protein